MGSNRPTGVLRLAHSAVLFALAGAVLSLAFGFLWPAQLRRTDEWFLGVAYAVFVIRTLVAYAGFGIGALALIAFVLRMRRAAAAALFVGMLALIFGWMSPAPGGDSMTTSYLPRLTLFSANLGVGRADAVAVLRQIRAHDPDVVLLQEYTPAFALAVRDELRRKYPYSVEEGHIDAFGQAVFSRLAFVGDPVPYPQPPAFRDGRATGFVSPADPAIRFVVNVGGHDVVVQNTHLSPPTRPEYLGEQRLQAAWIADWAAHEARPMVVMGDFNFTGSSAQATALRRSGLREAGGGRTWPSRGLKRHLPGFRIDRCYSKGFEPISSAVGERTGSDHRPIIVELALR